jgi:sec-independent protein translocase protein TatA
MPHIGLPELAILLVLVLVLFGAGRVGKVGGELGTAIREFRKGLTGDDATNTTPTVPDADKVPPTNQPR